MKFDVPAPPDAAFAPLPGDAKNAPEIKAAPHTGVKIDEAFLHGVVRSSWILGAALSFGVWGIWKSPFVVWSFALGCALSIGLLASQKLFIQKMTSQRVAQIRAQRGWSKPNQEASTRKSGFAFPMWLFLPLKFLGLLVGIGLLMRYELIHPAAFVAGVPLVQIVMVAKVAGRILNGNRRSLHEVYVQKSKHS